MDINIKYKSQINLNDPRYLGKQNANLLAIYKCVTRISRLALKSSRSTRNRFNRITFAVISLFTATNIANARAEVISDRIFYCFTIGNVCDPKIYSLPLSDQTLVDEWVDPLIDTIDLMGMVRNVTPPVSIKYAIQGGDMRTWENIKATASLVSPSGLVTNLNVATSTAKEYSNLPCASYNYCILKESATGSLPLGSEAGQWQLKLTYEYSIYKTIGTVMQTLPVTKNIMIANALVVAATTIPTTVVVPTTVGMPTTTVPLAPQIGKTPSRKYTTVALAK